MVTWLMFGDRARYADRKKSEGGANEQRSRDWLFRAHFPSSVCRGAGKPSRKRHRREQNHRVEQVNCERVCAVWRRIRSDMAQENEGGANERLGYSKQSNHN